MAEGLARWLAAPGVEVASAGTRPNPKGIHPLAVQLLREKGIDPSGQLPKNLDQLGGEFDYVITLCDSAAQECPAFPARRGRMHWGLPDPDLAGGDPARELEMFRAICAEIERRLREWLPSAGLARDTGVPAKK